jgi:hypothetical protein
VCAYTSIVYDQKVDLNRELEDACVGAHSPCELELELKPDGDLGATQLRLAGARVSSGGELESGGGLGGVEGGEGGEGNGGGDSGGEGGEGGDGNDGGSGDGSGGEGVGGGGGDGGSEGDGEGGGGDGGGGSGGGLGRGEGGGGEGGGGEGGGGDGGGGGRGLAVCRRTEVGHLGHVRVREQHVAWLEVAVEHIVEVQVRQALGHVARNREKRGAPRASLLVHGAAVHQLEQRDLEQLEDNAHALHVVGGDAEHEHNADRHTDR